MPIAKGEPWGRRGPLPADGVIVGSDAAAARSLEKARLAGTPYPVLGLAGGDLCRTLGGTGDTGRLRSAEAMSFPVDLGEVLLDGALRLFVAHLVARTVAWGRVWVAMNAQWRGDWNVAPRAHPGDGLIDVYDARLSARERLQARARLPRGDHVPHPGIRTTRAASAQASFDRPIAVELDGERAGRHRNLSVRLEADAITVVV